MDLAKIRELAEQVMRDLTAEDAELAADALNYAADEIERLGRVVSTLEGGIAAFREAAQRDKAEIATLRSMVPTLKDGDAKPAQPDIAALLIENGRLRQNVMSLRKGIDDAREHIDADRIATAFAALGAL